MVIGLFIITAIPTVTGISQAYSAQKTAEEREKDKKRMAKFHIDLVCDAHKPRSKELNGRRVVLKDDLVCVGAPDALNPSPEGYVAEAFYIEYPDKERDPAPLGLVSQTRADPPLLNWIYLDKNTLELKYGNKTASIEHLVGPWDWTKDEEKVTFDDVDEFTAVQEPKTRRWRLYYDMNDDGLVGYVPKSWPKVEVKLERTLIPGA